MVRAMSRISFLAHPLASQTTLTKSVTYSGEIATYTISSAMISS